MATLHFRKTTDPSKKQDSIPKSVRVRRKYRKILAVSIILNIFLTTYLVIRILGQGGI